MDLFRYKPLLLLTAIFLVAFAASPALDAKERRPPTKPEREAAVQEFKLGQKLEKQKNYAAAISHYKAALSLNPRYYWAHQRIGVCYYAQRNLDSAVGAYQRYLEANPKDDKTRYFLHKLRKELASGRLNRRLAPKKTGRELKAAPFIGLGGGAVMITDTAFKQHHAEEWGEASASSGALPWWNLEAGYMFSNGFYGQALWMQGISRSGSLSQPLTAEAANRPRQVSYQQSALLINAGWAFRVGRNWLLGLQGGAGSSAAEDAVGTRQDGMAWNAEARISYLLGQQFALGLRLGYFSSEFSDFGLDHTGMALRAGLQWFLFPVRDPLPAARKRQ